MITGQIQNAVTDFCTSNSLSAGINFRRQIPTSKDDPGTERTKIFIMAVVSFIIIIQMKQKELNKVIYDDFKLKKPFGIHGLCNIISAL